MAASSSNGMYKEQVCVHTFQISCPINACGKVWFYKCAIFKLCYDQWTLLSNLMCNTCELLMFSLYKWISLCCKKSIALRSFMIYNVMVCYQIWRWDLAKLYMEKFKMFLLVLQEKNVINFWQYCVFVVVTFLLTLKSGCS